MTSISKYKELHRFFNKEIVDEMLELFIQYKEQQPIIDNLYNIECLKIVAETGGDGVFYGELAYLGENAYSDCLHEYRRLNYGDHVVHVVDVHEVYENLMCRAMPTEDGSGLIVMAPRGMEKHQDYLFMHELGHVVKILNGFSYEEAYELGELEEALANVFAISAYAKYLDTPESFIIQEIYEPAIVDTVRIERTYDWYDKEMSDRFYNDMRSNIETGLEFLNSKN